MRIFQKVCGGVDMKRLPINLERRRCRISLYRNGWSDEERSAVYVCAVPFEADAVGKNQSVNEDSIRLNGEYAGGEQRR
jgi:hypothetical protein